MSGRARLAAVVLGLVLAHWHARLGAAPPLAALVLGALVVLGVFAVVVVRLVLADRRAGLRAPARAGAAGAVA